MSNYRKTMASALREMYPLDEETQIDEATMSSSQIARLKKAYEPMRDKKISVSNADKLSAMMDKVGKDKEALIQLFKADIPFVSQSAVTKLITKHNMKGAEINKLREEVDLDEVDRSTYDDRIKKFTAMLKDAEKEKPLDKEWIKNLKRRIKSETDDWRKHLGIKHNNRNEGLEDSPNPANSQHLCAKNVVHEQWGAGQPVHGMHDTPDADGNIAWYDVMFEHGIEEGISINELKITEAGMHSSHDKDDDDKKMLSAGKMSQLHQYIKDKKSPEEIAKMMKVDVKTIKKLMSSYNAEEVEEGKKPGLWDNIHKKRKSGRPMRKPGEKGAPTDQDFKDSQEGAASDARRAMSRDKDFSRKDSADDDDDATDDDVKGASKNIMMQMRKAISLKGRFDVEFADKKKVKVSDKIAHAVSQKYNAMKKPADKEKFQSKIGKSYKDMLSALKEELQPQKESVLERMNRKIKENKDG